MLTWLISCLWQHAIPEGLPSFYRGYLAVRHLPPLILYVLLT